jgi:hypothetical protein
MLYSRFGVRAITVGTVSCSFAVTEPDFFVLGQGKLQWPLPSAFVGTITEGLMSAETTGAPPVVSSFEFYGDWHIGLGVLGLSEETR